jgi:hypothetical protein
MSILLPTIDNQQQQRHEYTKKDPVYKIYLEAATAAKKRSYGMKILFA